MLPIMRISVTRQTDRQVVQRPVVFLPSGLFCVFCVFCPAVSFASFELEHADPRMALYYNDYKYCITR